jgi:hypothetical protein
MANRYSLEASFNLIDNVTKSLDKITGGINVTGNALKKNYSEAEKRIGNYGKEIGKIHDLINEVAAKKIKSALEKSGKLNIFDATEAKKFNEILNQINASTVATDEAYKRVSGTIDEQWNSAVNQQPRPEGRCMLFM